MDSIDSPVFSLERALTSLNVVIASTLRAAGETRHWTDRRLREGCAKMGKERAFV